ncbi:MAG TPA: hypothetical protein VK608_00675, partial [Edaphobacter sp.]|nr:hypothetical protein [Edaphobacter sp.]
VREWLIGYRTQLPGAVVLDASYINREYRDRPAQIDTNQIYTQTPTGTISRRLRAQICSCRI